MKGISKQFGVSVMEVLVSMSIGIVVTGSMITLLSNSLYNTSRIVQMNKLTEDLRLTMQMISRDVRRASYTANAIYCLGNPDCSTFGEISEDVGSVLTPGDITVSDTNDCLWFLTDRDQDGDGTEDDAGGFRLRSVTVSASRNVGQIEMWVGGPEADCDATTSDDWVAITDPNQIDITAFSVDDDLSYDEVLLSEVSGPVSTTTSTMRIRRIRMAISGELVNDDSISRTVRNSIRIRNNYWF